MDWTCRPPKSSPRAARSVQTNTEAAPLACGGAQQRRTVDAEGALGTVWYSDPGGDVGACEGLQTVLNASRFSVRRLCGISPW